MEVEEELKWRLEPESGLDFSLQTQLTWKRKVATREREKSTKSTLKKKGKCVRKKKAQQ